MGNRPQVTAVFFDIGGTLASARFTSDGHLAAFDPDPQILDVLERLRARSGLILGIISNTGDEPRATIDAALDAATFPYSPRKLGEYFQDFRFRVYSSDVPPNVHPKPHPSIYQYAAGLAGLTPAACVYVGENAIERHGAEQAGMREASDPNLVERVLDAISLTRL
jgi:FMN phosphatase YigB (HAD superfamily)